MGTLGVGFWGEMASRIAFREIVHTPAHRLAVASARLRFATYFQFAEKKKKLVKNKQIQAQSETNK